MGSLMWIGPMRTTTAALVVAFLFKAVVRRDYRWLLALLAWMAGFEAVYLMTVEAFGRSPMPQYFELVGLSAGGWLVAFHVAGLRPRYEWLLGGIVLWVAWILMGFPTNEHYTAHVNWLAEAVNVVTKTSLGFAFYFAPSVRALAVDGTSAVRCPECGSSRNDPHAAQPRSARRLRAISDRWASPTP